MLAAATTTAVLLLYLAVDHGAACRETYQLQLPVPSEKEVAAARFEFSVNVVVRTHPGKAAHLPLMLGSLLLAALRAENVSLHVLVMNTDSELYEDTSYMRAALREQGQLLRACRCATFEIVKFPEAPWDGFYGYDYTQYALERLLDDSSARADYYLFTNGDNLFSDALFLCVLPYFEKAADLVAFSFVSHHSQRRAIPVEYRVGHIDLSSVFFRSSMLRQHRAAANFVPLGRNTTGLWEADWYFMERLIKQDGVRAEIVPAVLLFHQ
jgi:hypothetical protein